MHLQTATGQCVMAFVRHGIQCLMCEVTQDVTVMFSQTVLLSLTYYKKYRQAAEYCQPTLRLVLGLI